MQLTIVLGLLVATVGTAAADSNCEDVRIRIWNKFQLSGDHKDIKVVDMAYRDEEDDTWRTEAVSNHNVGYGGFRDWVKNLEKVGGETDVVIRVHFKYNTGGTSWSSRRHVESAPFKCVDGKTIDITVE